VPDENGPNCAAHMTSFFADIEIKHRHKINRPTTLDLVHNVEDYFSPLRRRRWEPNCFTGKSGWVDNHPHFMFEQVTLYPLHQLMSPFERGSTNFYGDVADVKVAARKDSNRKENHRLQQLAQQVRAYLRGRLSGAHCRRRRRRRRDGNVKR